MNKTTEALKLAEEALAFAIEAKWHEPEPYPAEKALAAIREALAEPVKQELNWGNNKFMPHEQPVKQEPVGMVKSSEEWGVADVLIAGLPIGTKLYAAPVDAKAIQADGFREGYEKGVKGIHEAMAFARAEALEEAAKVCDAYIDRLHEMRDNDKSLPEYQPELAGRQAGAGRCAAAIRGLK